MAVGIRCPDHGTTSTRRSGHYFAGRVGRLSVELACGLKAMEICCYLTWLRFTLLYVLV
jgi:hypothetical protein